MNFRSALPIIASATAKGIASFPWGLQRLAFHPCPEHKGAVVIDAEFIAPDGKTMFINFSVDPGPCNNPRTLISDVLAVSKLHMDGMRSKFVKDLEDSKFSEKN